MSFTEPSEPVSSDQNDYYRNREMFMWDKGLFQQPLQAWPSSTWWPKV
jgi:hypothetical protein